MTARFCVVVFVVCLFVVVVVFLGFFFSCFCIFVLFGFFVDENHDKLPTSSKLHTIPYKSNFIANSSLCTTTELSTLLTSCLAMIKNYVIKYGGKIYERILNIQVRFLI